MREEKGTVKVKTVIVFLVSIILIMVIAIAFLFKEQIIEAIENMTCTLGE